MYPHLEIPGATKLRSNPTIRTPDPMQGSEAPAVKPAPVAPNVNQRSHLRMGHILTLPVKPFNKVKSYPKTSS